MENNSNEAQIKKLKTELETIYKNRYANFHWLLNCYLPSIGFNDCADLLQDSFLRAYIWLPTFRGHSKLKTWISTIIVNTAHSYRYAESVRPLYYSNDITPYIEGTTSENIYYGSPCRFINVDDDINLVFGLLQKQSNEMRQAVALRILYGLKTIEIAGVLDLDVRYTRNLLFAFKQLAREMREINQNRGGGYEKESGYKIKRWD